MLCHAMNYFPFFLVEVVIQFALKNVLKVWSYIILCNWHIYFENPNILLAVPVAKWLVARATRWIVWTRFWPNQPPKKITNNISKMQNQPRNKFCLIDFCVGNRP